jgi:hypothetical protein
MNRMAFIAMGSAGAALLCATPASAGTLPPPIGGTTVTCGTPGLQSGVETQVCAQTQGTFVQLYGQISLPGPSPVPSPVQLNATLTGDDNGYSMGTVQQQVLFNNQTVQVRGVIGTIACGTTVHATFTVTSFGWPPAPVTLTMPTTC